MIRRHPDSMASEEARELGRELEARYAYPDWAVTYDVDEAEEDGEPAVRELLVIAKRADGVLEQLMWVDVDEILEMREMGADWLDEVDSVLHAAEDELEHEGPVGDF